VLWLFNSLWRESSIDNTIVMKSSNNPEKIMLKILKYFLWIFTFKCHSVYYLCHIKGIFCLSAGNRISAKWKKNFLVKWGTNFFLFVGLPFFVAKTVLTFTKLTFSCQTLFSYFYTFHVLLQITKIKSISLPFPRPYD